MDLNGKAVDIALALKQSAGNEQLAKELFQMLLAELPVMMSSLKTAIREKNWQLCWDHAHKLHGSTAYCGVPALRVVVQKLEVSIQAEEISQIRSHSDQLEIEINRLLDEGPGFLQQCWTV